MTKSDFQFRGVWLPAEVLVALEKGAINAREIILLAIVDALVTPTRGCWASNAYFGARIGASPETVRRMLANLEHLNYLRRWNKNGRREIETAWSRVAGCSQVDKRQPHKTVGHPPQNCGVYIKEEKKEEMTFFEKQAETSPTTQDLEIANLLISAVHRKLPGRRINAKSWAKEIAILRRESPTAPILETAQWYVTAIGGKWVPQVYSGRAFRQKYMALEAAKERAQSHAPKELVVGAQAQAVASRLTELTWPKGIHTQLPQVVQRHWNRLDAWQQAQAKIATQSTKNIKLSRFIAYIRETTPPPAAYIFEWWNQQHLKVTTWSKWSGVLTGLEWHANHPHFVRTGRGWAIEYCGQSERWDQYHKLVTEVLDAN